MSKGQLHLAPSPASRIVRDSKLPFYHQLYEILRERIRSGEWQPGDAIPTEKELTESFAISRATVRQALDALVHDGLIHRQRGRGGFVAHPTIEQGSSHITSFTEEMRQRGVTPRTEVLSAALQPASEEVAERLGIAVGEEMVHLVRLRLADNEPMAVEEAYFIHRYCPGLLGLDYQSESLRDLMERTYGIRWLRAKQVTRAIPASRDLATTLGIRPGAPVLYIERVSYNTQDTPLEFLRMYNRGDRYALYSELRG